LPATSSPLYLVLPRVTGHNDESSHSKSRYFLRRHARSPFAPHGRVEQTLTYTSFFWSLVARKIPFDDPVVLNYVRAGYIIAQGISIAVFFYISAKVGGIPF
jgi:hypothetical protein